MRIGLFTETYLPQVSGVATSIETLANQLTKMGHNVFIFTTTDPHANPDDDPENVIRLRSIPLISLAERRFVIKGVFAAYQIARTYELDIIHTQTEFGVGVLGKLVARQLKIPVIHTLHTKYEDYVHYIAKGKILRPGMIKYIIRTYLHGVDGIIVPSKIVFDIVNKYGITLEKRIIPTGIELNKFLRPEISRKDVAQLRKELGIQDKDIMLLSLSRIGEEKNIQAVIKSLVAVREKAPVKLIIVGSGPYLENLQKLVAKLELTDSVTFAGLVDNEQTAYYYKAADFFISASTSETQGLTYIESLASGTPILATNNSYLQSLVTCPAFGRLFDNDDQIADTILKAIETIDDFDQTVYDTKLYEISAENFAKQVYEFYLDKIISNDQKLLEQGESIPRRTARIVRQAPAKTVKSVSRTPKKVAYFAKKTMKHAKILRKYGKMK
ncbi:1,2-diacylglycerol 3-glucosyltransferase [Lactococcus hodotermopsidis]|uniref:1,2-diacylglycerol 3-glucosyltransferase n=1 Tax=Pseudolactococcus hodotermopsidis TaxID=2709157 RepID=A0A6A0BFD5_9LACT|nr:glycosyltransferase family 4 protein [Lactococcus hodotermopsidis]GFH43058.1 1,2-diacylglycerol 3-glucosyltransferase [Lactococcus hodotermopsidis]